MQLWDLILAIGDSERAKNIFKSC